MIHFRIRAARLLAAALVCGTALLAAASPASAHGANGQPIPDATHYLTTISMLTPTVPGLSAKVDPRGEWLSVTNLTTQTLTILGYAREPYLRIDPSGVSENAYSPTLALNQSLFGDVSQLGDSSLPANWQHTSPGREVRWHDHRIHWMGADRPPAVKTTPAQAHLVGNWNVHMLLGTAPVTISGTLNWLPLKPVVSRFMTYFLIVDSVVFAIIVAVVTWFVRRRHTRGTGRPAPSVVSTAPPTDASAIGAAFSSGR